MDSKDAIITELRRLVAGLERQLQWQAERISELELQLAKAKKDSSTSSKPTSRDIVKPPAKKKTGGRPELSSQPIFGPRMLAMVGWLKSKAHCSYTTIELWMDDVLQVPISRGYLAKLCTGVISESLAGRHEEVKQAVPLQAQLGSDETSIKNNGKNHWIWCITAATFSLFHIASSRAREVLEELIGETYQGHLNFDYFSANCSFAWNFDIKAQYCWAHLIRDIRFLLNDR